MARKTSPSNAGANAGAGPEGQPVRNPIEQRSQNNQATGWYDPEDYHGSGPLPVGNAPVHPQQTGTSSIPIGIDLNENPNENPLGNPGDVPNTESRLSGLDREALGDSVEPDKTLKKAPKA